jgi:hypothetical protein
MTSAPAVSMAASCSGRVAATPLTVATVRVAAWERPAPAATRPARMPGSCVPAIGIAIGDGAPAISLCPVREHLSLPMQGTRHAVRGCAIPSAANCDWTVEHAGWVLILMSPEEQEFYGKTLEEALAWCLVWLMAPALGLRPSLANSPASTRIATVASQGSSPSPASPECSYPASAPHRRYRRSRFHRLQASLTRRSRPQERC